MNLRYPHSEEGYKRFKEQISSAKKFLESLDQQGLQNIKRAFIALRDARKELSGVFSSTYYICHQCKGRCCGCFCGRLVDAIYFALLGKELPPVEKHLNPHQIRPYPDSNLDYNIHYCFFLGVNGCVLGEDKPYVCLLHTCEKFPEEIKLAADLGKFRTNKAADDFFNALRLAGCTVIF